MIDKVKPYQSPIGRLRAVDLPPNFFAPAEF